MFNIQSASPSQLRATLQEIQKELVNRQNKICAEKVKAFESALVDLWDNGINVVITADNDYCYGERIPFGLDDIEYDYSKIKLDYWQL